MKSRSNRIGDFRKGGYKVKNKRIVVGIALAAGIVLAAAVSGWAGYRMGYQKGIKNASGDNAQYVYGTTIYAEITEIREAYISISGLDVNDINGRGDFYFSMDEETSIQWRHTDITVEDLKVGDRISVTYTGDVIESYPAELTEIRRIDLLEDER
jgi:hypothetical protein